MTNIKIPCTRTESNHDADGKSIFIVPVVDCMFKHYAHVEINGWDKLKIDKLDILELQIIDFLFDDMPVKDISENLTIAHTKSVPDMLAKLRQKIGVQTDHGLVSKLHNMGFEKLIKP